MDKTFVDDVLSLPPVPGSVGAARRMVRQRLEAGDHRDLAESAALLVSELVTNALLHAGTPIELAVSITHRGVRVAVSDGSPHLPARRHYDSGTGRGLLLLEEMVDDWGVIPTADGKTVWFEVLAARPWPRTAGAAIGRFDRDGGVPARGTSVELRNVPLLLHAAWQEHAVALLREYLLLQLEADEGLAIQRHAHAQDAVALLGEAIPAPAPGDVPSDTLITASRLNERPSNVTLQVPAASVPHFRLLEQMLDEADAVAGRGGTLTAPVQPELQDLRRWACGQVLAQVAGAAPVAWRFPEHTQAIADVRPSQASQDVQVSPEPAILADDAGGIVAVSPSALAALGYAEDQLVGKRIATIIPARFREAHVAGFTLHFLNGRDVMLDSPVVLPVLRADGVETEFEIRIRAQAGPDGRRTFRATLTPPG